MKTLLLSLIGIVGSTSASIVPFVTNNHYNVNEIETAKAKQTAEFTLSINTSKIEGIGNYKFFDEFSNFFHNVQDYIKTHKISEWKVISGTSKFSKLNPANLSIGEIKEADRGLHANNGKVEATDILVTGDGHGKFGFSPSASISDGESHYSIYLNGYRDIHFTLDEIQSGFTVTYTIEYTAEEGTDISVGNFKESPVTEMDFLTTGMDDFQKNITTSNASSILKDLGFDVKPEWLTFKEAIWLETNETVNEDLLQGKLGAGLYNIKVTIATNSLGNENNFVGEMTFFMTLKFNYGDLSIYNNTKVKEASYTKRETYKKAMENFREWIQDMVYSLKNAFGLEGSSLDLSILEMSDIYDSVTHKKFTEEDFNKIPEETTVTVYTFVHPGKDGKRLGILNSAKISMDIINTIL